MSPLKANWVSKPWSHSIHKRKKKGEKGTPCLMPLDGLIKPYGASLIRIEYDIVDTQSIMRLIHLLLKPNFFIMHSKKGHSTLS